MNAGTSYAPGFELGQPIVSRVVARVPAASGHTGFAEGDLVWGFLSWPWQRERGEGPQRIDQISGAAQPLHLGAGMPGLTARTGAAIEIGQPAPGDTVFVSGGGHRRAAGGSWRAGARVVGGWRAATTRWPTWSTAAA